MWIPGGLASALSSGLLTLVLVRGFAAGLPSIRQQLVIGILVAFASGVGFLAGSAVLRRALRGESHVALFTMVTAGVAGGIVGLVTTVALLFVYLYTYSGWPSEPIDAVLYVLAFPSLGALAFFLGALLWSAAGFLAGGALSLLTSRLR
jgi:hypothetical protein